VKVVVAGAGVFGLSAALELARRGHAVHVVDAGGVPFPRAESTDISKVVRLEYGADVGYVELAERALDGWRRWNQAAGEPLFHETGVLFMRRTPLAPGTFEGDSLEVLRARGHRARRLGADELRARFPAWNADRYVEGVYNEAGGWVESGKVVAWLARQARAAGVTVDEGRPAVRVARPGGLVTHDGATLAADRVLIAAGAWTPALVPATAPFYRAHAQPVFHLRPADPARFVAERFPVFGADIAATGYYGFPLHPRAGVVKIANHGPGRALDPSDEARAVTADETAALRAFLGETFPELAAAPIIESRACIYCDTWDGHFWIAEDPDQPGLIVATGGSGHAFKFAPELGPLIADVVLGKPHPRFRWRPEVRPQKTEEEARYQR
jgi:glycine/D-amino acid oxidase-like deaminating enzyme